jgi:hypothetical protein
MKNLLSGSVLEGRGMEEIEKEKREKRRRKQEGRLYSFSCLRIDTVPEKSEGK